MPVKALNDASSSGNVINPYLPQPGQFSGRRILKVADISKEYWSESAAFKGIPWIQKLGISKIDGGTFEIRNPELLTSTWFSHRAKVSTRTPKATLQRAQLSLSARAQELMATTG